MALKRVYEDFKKKFEDRDAITTLDFKYVKQMCFLLSSIGSWPHKQFGKRRLDAILSAYNMILIIIGTVSPSLGVVYLWINRHTTTFFDMGHILLTILLDILYVQKLIFARTDKYRDTIKDYLLQFHLFFFEVRSEFARKIRSQIHVISGLLTFYVLCISCCGMSLFSFVPWYNNYSRNMFNAARPPNSTFEQAVYYYFPIDGAYTTEKGFWVLFTFNIFSSYNVTCGIVTFDLLLSLMVLQIWGHLKILKHDLLSFPPPEDNMMYSADENVKIRALLQQNIVHHNMIIQFVEKCSDTFSEYLFMFYLLLQLISCVLLLELTTFTADALGKYGPLTIAMYQQLIQVSILFEMLNTKGEQLIDAVYELPWEFMDTSNKRTVLFLLHRVQTPLSLKAGKLVPVGVNTMFGILKTTFSYYMMLSTVAKEK